MGNIFTTYNSIQDLVPTKSVGTPVKQPAANKLISKSLGKPSSSSHHNRFAPSTNLDGNSDISIEEKKEKEDMIDSRSIGHKKKANDPSQVLNFAIIL